ncbi:substrate-binding domain-containing protein [Microbacteriaceae bacterium VKM Ac-2854]|nr:substrate-binding domain-containing protein [Microbacteriaceae bacterium VKM Ac-2854]
MKLSITKRALGALALAATSTVILAACSGGGSSSADSGAGLADGFGSRNENRNAYFLTYYNPASDTFWAQIQKGADDAAELGGLTLTSQTADGDPDKMVDLVNTAIATKPSVIYMPFNEGEKWVQVACDAHDAGIQVVSYNVPAPESAGDCVSGFVGQDFREVGTIVGEAMLKQIDLKDGDEVLFAAEEPDQNYAIERGGGVQDAIDAAGIDVKGEFLRTTATDADALDAMTTWITAHPDAKAIVPLGGVPHRNAVAAEDAAGSTIPIIGFDTSAQVVDGIKAGRILATADQQGYVQGFQSVTQGVLYIDFGLSPANINSGGLGLITKDNVDLLEAKDLQGIRY